MDSDSVDCHPQPEQPKMSEPTTPITPSDYTPYFVITTPRGTSRCPVLGLIAPSTSSKSEDSEKQSRDNGGESISHGDCRPANPQPESGDESGPTVGEDYISDPSPSIFDVTGLGITAEKNISTALSTINLASPFTHMTASTAIADRSADSSSSFLGRSHRPGTTIQTPSASTKHLVSHAHATYSPLILLFDQRDPFPRRTLIHLRGLQMQLRMALRNPEALSTVLAHVQQHVSTLEPAHGQYFPGRRRTAMYKHAAVYKHAGCAACSVWQPPEIGLLLKLCVVVRRGTVKKAGLLDQVLDKIVDLASDTEWVNAWVAEMEQESRKRLDEGSSAKGVPTCVPTKVGTVKTARQAAGEVADRLEEEGVLGTTKPREKMVGERWSGNEEESTKDGCKMQ